MMRSLQSPGDLFEQIPGLVRNMGEALDSAELRLRNLGYLRGVEIELTDFAQWPGTSNWLGRANRLNGLGDVGPFVGEMSSALTSAWDAIAIFSGDPAEKVELRRKEFEDRRAAAVDLEPMFVLAAALVTLEDEVGGLSERGPRRSAA